MELNKEIDQREHWESIYRNSPDRFGFEPSIIAQVALRMFQDEGAKTILELGCGQGRDTLLFLAKGIEVIGLDYSPTCLTQLKERATTHQLEHLVDLRMCDIREGIHLPNHSVDGCFSHMFFTMRLEESELSTIFREVLRVLKPGGLNIYSVRNVNDPHFQNGRHIEEDMWEMNGFGVHYFSIDKVKRLASGYKILSVEEFEEGVLPKRLYQVVLRKPL